MGTFWWKLVVVEDNAFFLESNVWPSGEILKASASSAWLPVLAGVVNQA